MSYIVTITILIILMIREFYRYKSIISATVIYPTMWIIALSGLLIEKGYFQVSIIVLLTIVFGYILFCTGFHIRARTKQKISSSKEVFQDFNSFGLELCYYISLLVGLIYIYLMRHFLSLTSFVASLSSIRQGIRQNELKIPVFLNYFSAFVRCTLYYSWAILLRRKKQLIFEVGRNNKIYVSLRNKCIILSLLYVVILMTSFSRNSLLFFALPIVFIVFIEKDCSNRIIILSLVILLGLFLVFFFWFSQYKANYLFEGRNYWDVAFENLFLYLSGGIVGLDQLLQKGSLSFFCFNGLSHTFSLVTSIIDKLFGTHITPSVVQSGIMIGNSTSTNVFTVYQWTALDLGLVYAVMMQFFLGLIYGEFYKRVCNGSIHGTYWYSFLSYSLVMMFFQDQYFSISQSWFNLLLTSIVIYHLLFKLPIRITIRTRTIRRERNGL